MSAKPAPDGGAVIVVADNGTGYTPSREQSIGLSTIQRLLDQISARLEVTSACGTRCEIHIQAERLPALYVFGGNKPCAGAPAAPRMDDREIQPRWGDRSQQWLRLIRSR